MSEQPNNPRRYKFMTNILTNSMHRTTYVKALKKVTMDAQVSFIRLIVFFSLTTIIVIATIRYLLSNIYRAKFTGIPLGIIVFCLFLMLVSYLVSSRNKSMLYSSYLYLLFYFNEKRRILGGVGSRLKTVGILSFKKGIILFEDGSFGLLYDVEGQISRSVLPSVAMQSAEIKSQYLVARTPSSQEMLITSIQEADVTTQLNNLKKYHDKATGDPVTVAWKRYMSDMQKRYIEDNMVNKDYTVNQVVLIRDDSLELIRKSKNIFESSVKNGLYSKARLISDKDEAITRLGVLTVMSTRRG